MKGSETLGPGTHIIASGATAWRLLEAFVVGAASFCTRSVGIVGLRLPKSRHEIHTVSRRVQDRERRCERHCCRNDGCVTTLSTVLVGGPNRRYGRKTGMTYRLNGRVGREP